MSVRHDTASRPHADGPSGSGAGVGKGAAEGRPSRKRQAIRDAAVTVFLRRGYLGTSVEQIASVAGVSKQTVYNQFSDEQTLFTESIRATIEPIHESLGRLINSTDGADSTAGEGFEEEITGIARRLILGVARPEVVQLRRIVISEVDRFPEPARNWYEQGPARSIRTLAARFTTFAEQGLLRADDITVVASGVNPAGPKTGTHATLRGTSPTQKEPPSHPATVEEHDLTPGGEVTYVMTGPAATSPAAGGGSEAEVPI